MCYDQFNEFADISLGDAWLPELKEDKTGTSILIARTEIGERVLQEASSAGAIKILEIPESKVVQSQKGLIRNREILGAHLLIARLFGKCVPRYNVKVLRLRFNKMKYLVALFDYINAQIPFNPIAYSLLKHAPLPLLHTYASIIDGFARLYS